MEMPKPTAAHLQLAALVGSWVGEEKMYPSPWDPNGGTAVGRVNNRAALNGLVVIQDYEQERGGAVNFRGHGIFAWDGETKEHVLYWFDSVSQAPNLFRGTFEGNALIVTSSSTQGHVRATFELIPPNRYRYRMEVSGDGNAWMPMMEGAYKKQG
jgi:hypothetical protein